MGPRFCSARSSIHIGGGKSFTSTAGILRVKARVISLRDEVMPWLSTHYA